MVFCKIVTKLGVTKSRLHCFGGDPPPFPFEATSFIDSPLSYNLGILNWDIWGKDFARLCTISSEVLFEVS